eukprot:CAMPEP_0202440484 /NCGR_PEP_ID=MMETSP1345-20130828/36722_1 /ASSEMBLY_ACC=CAM_ASM_000843 /TAXON_ID=342563 /ORGANISM="Fabrea Fabrea salina" /LENGTH=232 /DNA_ID=CAMNT_0049055085 /DNA_START=764 /DNA_END=1460 /DNA_ORIENTATION=+
MEEYESCNQLLHSDKFQVVTEAEDIKIESTGSGNDFYTRSTVIIPSGVFETLAVLYETDLLGNWVSSIRGSEVLLQPSRFRKLLRYHFSFPWPVSDRECILEFCGIPIHDEAAVIILMKNAKGEKYLGTELPSRREMTQLIVPMGCLYLQILSPQRTKVVFCVNASANITFIPNWLCNFASKHIMYYMMQALRDKIVNFKGSVYEERVTEKKDTYDYIMNMIREYLILKVNK